MADFPALPLWTDSYLADTRHLSTLEHGAYLLLLMEAWRRPDCSLPDDDRLLARLAGLSVEEWADIKSLIMGFWKLDGRSKTWTQKKLSKERVFVADRSAKQRDRAAKRWKETKKDDAAAMPDGCRIDAPTPTPTPTPTLIEKEPPSESPKKPEKPKEPTPKEELLRVLDPDRAKAVIDHRNKIKKPLSSYAARLLAKQFELVPDPNAAADHMIGNGWQGFQPSWMDRGTPQRQKSPFMQHQDECNAAVRAAIDRGDDEQFANSDTIDLDRRDYQSRK